MVGVRASGVVLAMLAMLALVAACGASSTGSEPQVLSAREDTGSSAVSPSSSDAPGQGAVLEAASEETSTTVFGRPNRAQRRNPPATFDVATPTDEPARARPTPTEPSTTPPSLTPRVLVTTSAPLDSPPTAVDTTTTTTTTSTEKTALPPLPRQRVPARLTEVLVRESFPVLVDVRVAGTRPTSCHRLAWNGPKFLPDRTITLEVTAQASRRDGCASGPETFSRLISVGELDSGEYTLVLNGTPFAFTI